MQVMLAEYRSMTTSCAPRRPGLDQLLAEVAARLVEGTRTSKRWRTYSGAARSDPLVIGLAGLLSLRVA